MFTKIRAWFRRAPAVFEPAPSLSTIVDHVGILFSLVPETYLLAKEKYPFLPARCSKLDLDWYAMTTAARANFILEYVSLLYARVPLDAAVRSPLPLLVFRTTDHPHSARRDPRVPFDERGYMVFFDTDADTRVEIHMGHPSFLGLATVLAGDHFASDRRSDRRKAARA